jgi:hypothetical protein
MNSKMIIKYLDERQISSAIETIANILEYFDQFKIFTTPSEKPFDYGDFDFENVTRVYDASIMHEQTDILYNISFRIDSTSTSGSTRTSFYAYAHMRINGNELVRGTLFVTNNPKIFFMTTLPSIEETDDIYSFLKEDGLELCFDDSSIPTAAKISRKNYDIQINTL